MSVTRGFTTRPANRARSNRRRPGPAFWAGFGILAGVLLLAGVMTFWPPYDPLATVGGNLEGPSAAHPLGTDNVGRDSLTRLALAGRSSLVISGVAALLAALLGTAVGLIAGYTGGWVDTVLMRLVDAALAIPAILVALVVGVIIGTGAVPLVIALGIVFAPSFARVMRAPVVALRERDFVLAAQLSGARAPQIVLRHLLPNALTPLLVQFASVASAVVLLEAALSYLGQGVQAPEPSAGRMISEFTRFMQLQPLVILFPALLIVLLSAGWNLLADGVQEFLQPRRETHLPQSRRRPRSVPSAPSPRTTAPSRQEATS
ncbi:ABC transporter permease [Microbacterium indicum]|uniref:ABC transporter permease n=1 Tax=Microbacterium indicum TaxID=358100 RepID=UPI0009FFA098|nr:ABC transporter permease [Microbacterium indicum]